MERWLWEERGLLLKHPQARILSCRGHLDALGFRLRREGLTALPRARRRLRRRLATELHRPAGKPLKIDIQRSLAASAGVILFGP